MDAQPEILVVEDDPDIRETVLEALEHNGFSAIGAADGVDAVETLRASDHKFDLVLTDLAMPRMDGQQLREEMKKTPAWATIPVIVLSSEINVRARAMALGAAGYLRKPFRLNELFNLLVRVLSRTASRTAWSPA
jgi:two-component system chemotaxis response regulator CheY